MGHSHHATLAIDPWMLGIAVIVLIALVAGIFWLLHRNRVASDGLSPVERKSLPYLEKEILSMLRQHGGSLMQDEIVDTLPGDFEELVEAIRAMEVKDLINREWRKDQGTYSVSVAPKGPKYKSEINNER